MLGKNDLRSISISNLWNIYYFRHDWLDRTMDLQLDLIIYLRTDPEVSYSRMRKRNRKEESKAEQDYLTNLHYAYDDWLVNRKFGKLNVPLLEIDANQDIDTVKEIYQKLRDIIIEKDPIRALKNLNYEGVRLVLWRKCEAFTQNVLLPKTLIAFISWPIQSRLRDLVNLLPEGSEEMNILCYCLSQNSHSPLFVKLQSLKNEYISPRVAS